MKIFKVKLSILLTFIILLNSLLYISMTNVNVYAVTPGYILYDMTAAQTPLGTPLTGPLAPTVTVQFWHFAGATGYWNFSDLAGSNTNFRLSNSEMDTVIKNGVINKYITMSTPLPTNVINQINNNGGNTSNIKIKITQALSNIVSNPTTFEYKIDMTTKRLLMKFIPQFNVETDINYWDNTSFVNKLPPLPVVKDGYGKEVFAIWDQNNPSYDTACQLNSGSDYGEVHTNREVYMLPNGDGAFYPRSEPYINTAGVTLSPSQWSIGHGTFDSGGAVGIEFGYKFNVTYYETPDIGDFTILDEYSGSDITNSIQNINIGNKPSENSYPIILHYTGNIDNVDHVEWVDNFGHTIVALPSVTDAFTNAQGSLSPGTKNTYKLRVYYKDGSMYPDLTKNPPDQDNINHYVTFSETTSISGSGQITFTPNSSNNITGNRQGWVNKDISVKVSVTGSNTITSNGSKPRGYQYWDSCKSTHQSPSTTCVQNDDGTQTCTTTYNTVCDGGYVSSSASCNTVENYKISSLTVWGEGETVTGNTVNLPQQTISDDGTYTISQELKNITLHAKIISWVFDSSAWGSDSPPRGSWTDTSSLGQNTTTPTDTYESNSGDYFLDKTVPTHTVLNPSSHNWTNQTITVPVQIKDNLSGFYSDETHFDIVDKSYYQNPTFIQKYLDGNTDETENAVINSDGIYRIDVYAQDIAKNTMAKTSYEEYKFDSTAPYDATFSDDNRSYIDEDVTVTVTVGDNLSGVEETRYILNNSPSDTTRMMTNGVQTSDRQSAYNTFNVAITQPGSWWLHVYQRDRAGNVTNTVSNEYKIVRLGNSNNQYGQNFSGLSNQVWVEPRQTNDRIPRATRFDVLMEVYGLTDGETYQSYVDMTLPNWVDDSITNKVNGSYSVTLGTVIHDMYYYTGHTSGPQGIATPSTVIQWWRAFIPPYGTPLTMDRNGNRLAPQTSISVQLTYTAYSPSKTHISTLYYDIVPETKIKTEIIKNQY